MPEVKETIKTLADSMIARFTPPEFWPGCQVMDVTDKDYYTTDNGYIEAIVGPHGQQRVRYQGFPPNAGTSNFFVDVEFFPAYHLYKVFGTGEGGTAKTGGYKVDKVFTPDLSGTVLYSDNGGTVYYPTSDIVMQDNAGTARILLDPGTSSTEAFWEVRDQTGALKLRLSTDNTYRFLVSRGGLDVSQNIFRVDVTGTPQVEWDETNDVFSWNKGHIISAGDLTIPDDLVHVGDTDTLLSFTDDQINIQAGGITMIRLDETVQDVLYLGDVAGTGDVDVNLNNGQVTLTGSTGNVVITNGLSMGTVIGNLLMASAGSVIGGTGSSNPSIGASASANRVGNIYLASSTFINALNSYRLTVGPIGTDVTMITLTDSTQDTLDLGDVAGTGDVDIDFSNGQMFLRGSDGFLGIGNSTPQELLHVGAGTDASGVTSTVIYASNAGTTAISARDSTNDVETFLLSTGGLGVVGTFTSSSFEIRTGNTSRIRINTTGGVFVNDTANSFNTSGLTINQGASDDELIAGKSSDIAHGMTTLAETDTFYTVNKQSATTGGVRLDGYTTGNNSIHMRCNATTDDTTKSTGAVGNVLITASKKSGTTISSHGANANLVVVRNFTTSVFLVDAEGDIHYDGTNNPGAWDAEDDTQVLRALSLAVSDPATVVKNEFDKFVRYHKDDLIKLGVLSDGGFINLTQVTRVMMGALWQQHTKIQELEAKLNGIN